MAPSFCHANSPGCPTVVDFSNCIPTDSSSYYSKNFYFKTYCYGANFSTKKRKETKKEKIARIAKEKMHASWKTQDQISSNLFKLKQLCKPQFRIHLRPF